MKRSAWAVLLLVVRHLLGAQSLGDLTELSFAELLARKKILRGGNSTGSAPAMLYPANEPAEKQTAFRGLHERALGKTFHDDDRGEDEDKVHKKKGEHKVRDILNTSIMALSYLAFGGYLLCMIASALREKRRKIFTAYPTAGAAASNQLAHVLQHYTMHRPTRPFIKFPAVTLHPGGKRRRKRRSQGGGRGEGTRKGLPLVGVVDLVGILALGGR